MENVAVVASQKSEDGTKRHTVQPLPQMPTATADFSTKVSLEVVDVKDKLYTVRQTIAKPEGTVTAGGKTNSLTSLPLAQIVAGDTAEVVYNELGWLQGDLSKAAKEMWKHPLSAGMSFGGEASAVFPEQPVAVGESWEADVVKGFMVVNLKLRYTLKEVTDTTYVLGIEGKSNVPAKQKQPEVAMTGDLSATITIDRQTGLPVPNGTQAKLNLQMSFPGKTMKDMKIQFTVAS